VIDAGVHDDALTFEGALGLEVTPTRRLRIDASTMALRIRRDGTLVA
jgi:hypothetical protein